jgi:hypothetical protein
MYLVFEMGRGGDAVEFVALSPKVVGFRPCRRTAKRQQRVDDEDIVSGLSDGITAREPVVTYDLELRSMGRRG